VKKAEYAVEALGHKPLLLLFHSYLYPTTMYLEPFDTLSWAYQLHYYLCFGTHRHRATFAASGSDTLISDLLAEVCTRHDYHILKPKAYPDHIRLLVSLRPAQAISKVVQTIKANSAREYGIRLNLDPPLWAKGYLARSVGRVRIQAVKQYLDEQSEHHGYASRIRPPVFRYRAQQSVALDAPHASFDLNHHLVLSTRYRRGVFTSSLGEALGRFWLTVAAKRGFEIDQMTILPDHAHMLVRTIPKMSIEVCALSLMNNGQHFIGRNYNGVMIEEGLDQLWRGSAYAGTCGRVTTALLKAFLSREAPS
jgi:putative transposase